MSAGASLEVDAVAAQIGESGWAILPDVIDADAVVTKLERVVYPQLKRHPHFGPNIKKLRDFEPDTWRYRIGAWRFFYEIDEEERIVFVIAAAHRGSAY